MRWFWQKRYAVAPSRGRAKTLVIIRRDIPMGWNEADEAYLQSFLRSQTGRKLLEIYKDTMIENILPEWPDQQIDSQAINWIVQGKSYLFEFLAKHCNWELTKLTGSIVPEPCTDQVETPAQAAAVAEDTTLAPDPAEGAETSEMVMMQGMD